MKEKDFQTEFGKRNTVEGCFELKLCKGTSLPFNALADHQREALLAACGSGLFHKITDQPVFKGSKTRFTRPKPFDCFFLADTDSYVVVMFWIPRKKKDVYYIRIEEWVNMVESVDRKSLTEGLAAEFGTFKESYLK
jgi:hypothetical protein